MEGNQQRDEWNRLSFSMEMSQDKFKSSVMKQIVKDKLKATKLNN